MRKRFFSQVAAVLAMLMLSSGASAAILIYEYTILGDVVSGDESQPNNWNLTGGDVISATGQFTVDLGTPGSETGTVIFSVGDTMTIDLLGGQSLTEGDALGSISLTFSGGDLTDFDFLQAPGAVGDFSSYFMFFDDLQGLFGEWRADATLTVVPVPAAVWLFGSGLLALAGWRRRR